MGKRFRRSRYFCGHGIGIPKENLPKIFNPFSPPDRMGPTGLSITKILLKSTRKIDVESQVNMGTKIMITLQHEKLEQSA